MQFNNQEFWDIVYRRVQVSSKERQESIVYCKGRYDYAIDLINEGKPRDGCQVLMDLNYYIDSCNLHDSLKGLYEHVFDILNSWDFDFSSDSDGDVFCTIGMGIFFGEDEEKVAEDDDEEKK